MRSTHRIPQKADGPLQPPAWARRRGAAMVEAAIVLSIFLIMVFAMLDLGSAVFQRTVTGSLAHEAARLASIHGELASPQMSQWGSSTYTATASATDQIMTAIRPYLGVLDPTTTTVKLEWLDGNNSPESRIRATVTTTRNPLVISLFGATAWQFSASTTMQISH
jgi:Flp pilus assembly protein TadG